MQQLRGLYRFLGFALITIWSIYRILLLGLLLGQNEKRAIRIRRKLARRLVRWVGLECEVSGRIPQEGFLGVTNHRSYIDSICIFQYLDACPVVKSEVANWPLIGFGLRHTATVFVHRENRDSRKKTREQMAKFVKRNISTIVFVEGTTFVGPEAGPFRPGTFMTASEGELPVVPIAIEFENQDAAWVGDDTFVPHFIRFFGAHRNSRVKIAFGEARINSDWEALRDDCHQWVNSELLRMRAEFDQSKG